MDYKNARIKSYVNGIRTKKKIEDSTIKRELIGKHFNDFKDYMNSNARFALFLGARASGKSSNVIETLFLWLLADESIGGCPNGLRFLVSRKYQANQNYSTWEQFMGLIDVYGLHNKVKIIKYNMHFVDKKITLIYKGLKDSDTVKSVYEPDGILIEEADQITEDDFNTINFTIRHGKRQYFIFISNPPTIDGKTSWLNRILIHRYNRGDSAVKVFYSTMFDNPFLSEPILHEARLLRETDPERYERDILGKITENNKSRVFNNLTLIDDDNPFNDDGLFILGRFAGLDFGATHPMGYTCVDVYYCKIRKILMFKIVNSDVRVIKNADDYYNWLLNTCSYNTDITMYADTSHKANAEALRMRGMQNVRLVKKGAGSVMSGINFLKQGQIIIDKTKNEALYFELLNFKFKQDKNGLFKDEPADNQPDDGIASLRYATYHLLSVKKQMFNVSV